MSGELWLNIITELEKRGDKGQIVSVRHLGELQEEIEERHQQGQLDKEFYRDELDRFNLQVPDTLPQADSLIIIAVPQPQIQLVFRWNGETYPLIIPPTYFSHPNREMETILFGLLAPSGYRVVGSSLPLKLLAVRSGLGSYGRNNICYIPGMGSFHRLMAFYSDLPCAIDHWQEAQILESCQECNICIQNCPTSAITTERFLIHAERCLTFHNEKPVDVPFPAWINPSWHDSLVGCMHCQMVCPHNREFLHWVEPGAEFSEEETSILLTRTSWDQLPTALAKKLEQFELNYIYDIFPRNLSVLLRK